MLPSWLPVPSSARFLLSVLACSLCSGTSIAAADDTLLSGYAGPGGGEQSLLGAELLGPPAKSGGTLRAPASSPAATPPAAASSASQPPAGAPASSNGAAAPQESARQPVRGGESSGRAKRAEAEPATSEAAPLPTSAGRPAALTPAPATANTSPVSLSDGLAVVLVGGLAAFVAVFAASAVAARRSTAQA